MAIALIICFVIIFNYIQVKQALENNKLDSLGKTLTIEVKEEYERDYNFIQNNITLDKWNKNEKEKLIQYMKSNDYKLKPGIYRINQGHKFEAAIEIFQFE